MIADIFNAVLYQPIYNGLLFLINIVPGHDAGLAVILVTLLVKLALFSVSFKSITSQVQIRALGPKISALKEQYKEDKQEQARQILALYKQHNVNPFSSFLVLLLQFPVLIALYWVFLQSGLSEGASHDLLYSFVSAPEMINMTFLGLVDVSEKSIILAVIAAGSQFLQSKLLVPKEDPAEKTKHESAQKVKEPSFKNDFAKSMQLQMRYVLPLLIGFIAYQFSGVVALYLIASNAFAIGQELYVRRHLNTKEGSSVAALPDGATG